MNKSKLNQDLKMRSAKIRHHEGSGDTVTSAKVITKNASKENELNKQTDSLNIITIKETEKFQKNPSNLKTTVKKFNKVSDKRSKNLTIVEPNGTIMENVRQSIDSNDALITDKPDGLKAHNDSQKIKEKWKEASRLLRKNLRNKSKYEDVVNDEAAASTADLKVNVNGRRSTVNTLDGITQRRFTKDSNIDFKFHEKQLNNNNSYIRSAIPCLSLTCAIICFTLNIVIPGSGTVLSGILAICFGKPRLESKSSGQYSLTVIVNMLVGVCQLCTTILLLVGWFWSVGWGVYMMVIAIERRRLLRLERIEKKNRELQTSTLKAFGNLRFF